VPLTHEQSATLRGVGGSYASRALQSFKAEGVLDTQRGAILVRNRDGLRLRACPVQRRREDALRGGPARGLSDRGA